MCAAGSPMSEPSLESRWTGGRSLTICSSAAVRGVTDWGRPLGGRELPSLTLRSSIEDAKESMVANWALPEPCMVA